MKLPETLYAFPRSILGAHVLLARLRPGRETRTLAERVRRLEAERTVRQLVNAYAYAFDAKDLELLLGLYAPDALLVNSFGTWRGLAAIRASHEHDTAKTEYAFHNVTNANVTVNDRCDEAWLSGYLYNFAGRQGTVTGTVATCLFHLKETAEGWRIVECRTAPTTRHSFGPAPAGGAEPRPEPTGPQTSHDLIRD